MTTRVTCPIDVCDWAFETGEFDPDASPGAFLGCGSVEAFAARASMLEARTLEHALRSHIETHTLEDWFNCVQCLRQKLAARDAQIAAFGTAA